MGGPGIDPFMKSNYCSKPAFLGFRTLSRLISRSTGEEEEDKEGEEEEQEEKKEEEEKEEEQVEEEE